MASLAVIKGTNVTFGTGTGPTLLTSASVNSTSQKKEIADGSGGFGAVVYFAVKQDITYETYAEDDPAPGDAPTIPSLIQGFVSGTVFVTNSEVVESAEDMKKSNVTAVSYAAVS